MSFWIFQFSIAKLYFLFCFCVPFDNTVIFAGCEKSFILLVQSKASYALSMTFVEKRLKLFIVLFIVFYNRLSYVLKYQIFCLQYLLLKLFSYFISIINLMLIVFISFIVFDFLLLSFVFFKHFICQSSSNFINSF